MVVDENRKKAADVEQRWLRQGRSPNGLARICKTDRLTSIKGRELCYSNGVGGKGKPRGENEVQERKQRVLGQVRLRNHPLKRGGGGKVSLKRADAQTGGDSRASNR